MVKLTIAQKERMEQMMRQGRKPLDIAKHFGCTEKWVQRLAKRVLTFGSIQNPKLCKAGRPPVLNAEMKEELGWLLVQRPDYYQEELQFYFLDNWHVWIHQSTISRAVTSLDLTWKVSQFRAAQQSNLLRDIYLMRIRELTADMLVFADESAASDKTLDRKYGYAPKGLPAVIVREKHHSARRSCC